MQAQPSSARRVTAQQEAIGRDLCRAHGSALVAIALLILDDPPDVCDVVAETIAEASRAAVDDETLDGNPADTPDGTPDGTPAGADEPVDARATRRRLARSVFDRSRGRLVARERFGQPAPARTGTGPELPAALQRLDPNLRSAVALTMFGGHGLEEAAAVLDLAPETVLGQLRLALAAAHEAARSIPDRPSDVDVAAGHRRPRGLVGARQRFNGQAEDDQAQDGQAQDGQAQDGQAQDGWAWEGGPADPGSVGLTASWTRGRPVATPTQRSAAER